MFQDYAMSANQLAVGRSFTRKTTNAHLSKVDLAPGMLHGMMSTVCVVTIDWNRCQIP